jgi:hypothetical protein
MNLNFSIHTGEYLIQVFSESKGQPGTVVVTQTDKDDAILIEGFKTIRTYAKAIEALQKLIPPDKNQLVLIEKGNEQWIAIFNSTFNWYNSLRTGYIKDGFEDPLSIINQNIISLDSTLDWLDDSEG